MSVYAIGDLHLSFFAPKPMDIFGEHWKEHESHIAQNWDKIVSPTDTVLIAGDISWALKPDQAAQDIDWIAGRPGKKIMVRGNHDYWWNRRATTRLQKSMPESITLLQGSSVDLGKVWVGGTRGWTVEDSRQQSDSIMQRELGYLDRALSQMPPDVRRIALLHYPPFEQDLTLNDFHKLLLRHRVHTVVYGHIHGAQTLQGSVEGITYVCVSADMVNFSPVLIVE